LRVQKKLGEYTITMNPLKDSKTMACGGESPYLPCPPIKFKLATDDERSEKMEEARQVLQSKGYMLCKCDSITQCRCRKHCVNEMLQCELKYLTHYLALDKPITLKDLQVSDSEIDIEFTPPSVTMTPKQKKGADNVTAETQYDQTDYALPSECLKQIENAREGGNGRLQNQQPTDNQRQPKGVTSGNKDRNINVKPGIKNSTKKKESDKTGNSKFAKNNNKEGAKLNPDLGKSKEKVEKTLTPRDQSVPSALPKQQTKNINPAVNTKADKSVKFEKNANPAGAGNEPPRTKAAGDRNPEKKSAPTRNKTFGK
jgi:hypothetical protein